MFVDFLNLKKTDQPPTYPPLFENTTQKVKKRKKVPLTQLKNHQKALKPQKSNQLRVGVFHRSEKLLSRAQDASIAQKLCYFTRWISPPLENCVFPRAVAVHRSGNAKSYAQEGSIAQKSQNPTRWSSPPLRNCRISRAGTVHHSGIGVFHA